MWQFIASSASRLRVVCILSRLLLLLFLIICVSACRPDRAPLRPRVPLLLLILLSSCLAHSCSITSFFVSSNSVRNKPLGQNVTASSPPATSRLPCSTSCLLALPAAALLLLTQLPLVNCNTLQHGLHDSFVPRSHAVCMSEIDCADVQSYLAVDPRLCDSALGFLVLHQPLINCAPPHEPKLQFSAITTPPEVHLPFSSCSLVLRICCCYLGAAFARVISEFLRISVCQSMLNSHRTIHLLAR